MSGSEGVGWPERSLCVDVIDHVVIAVYEVALDDEAEFRAVVPLVFVFEA